MYNPSTRVLLDPLQAGLGVRVGRSNKEAKNCSF